jgi:hypothetical protein
MKVYFATVIKEESSGEMAAIVHGDDARPLVTTHRPTLERLVNRLAPLFKGFVYTIHEKEIEVEAAPHAEQIAARAQAILQAPYSDRENLAIRIARAEHQLGGER